MPSVEDIRCVGVTETSRAIHPGQIAARDINIVTDWGRLVTNRTHLGLFNISFSQSQNVLKRMLKCPRFVQFGANLTQFGTNADIPE